MERKRLNAIINVRNSCMLFCVFILIIGFITTVFRYMTIKGVVKSLHIDNSIVRLVVNDDSVFREKDDRRYERKWQEQYPFSNEDNTEEKDKKIKHISLFEHKGKQPFDRLDTWSKDNIFAYRFLLETGRKWDIVIKWNELPLPSINANGVSELNDGFFIFLTSRHDFTEQANNIVNFSKWCKEKNIPFLYIQAPNKCRPDTITDDIHEKIDNNNRNMDTIIKTLKDNNISYLDLRKNIVDDGLSWHDLFFKTDHHWKMKTGLWAASIITDRLNEEYNLGINTKYLDANNYEVKKYDNYSLGSQGRRVSLARTAPDNFELYYPKFNTDMRYIVMSNNLDLDLHGNLSIYYDMENFSNGQDYYNCDVYSTYGYATQALEILYNNLCSNNLNVLVLKDSFSMVVLPFFAQGIHSLHTIDRRYFDGSIRDYIERNNIDVVLVLYGDGISSGGTDSMNVFFNFE